MSALFNQTNISPGTVFSTGGGGGGSNFNTITVSTIQGVYSITGEVDTTASNAYWNPIKFDFRPDQSVKGGSVEAILNWDAVDTGANNALILGARADSAYITSAWLGYSGAPLTIASVDMFLQGENETFMYLKGNGGGLGNISTGTPFISGSNYLSSVTAGSNVANMTALLSTLKSVYPACFS